MEGLLLPRPVIGGGGSPSSSILALSHYSMGSRSSSASSAERSLLLGALATHMGVLDARENDAQTIIRKSELWDEITRQFNAQALAPRSRQQIQTLYKNMKAKARRYEARLAEVASGVPPPDPDPISEILLGLLHQQLQHQRRHLQRLACLDTPYTHAHAPSTPTPPTDDVINPFSSHMDGAILTPEQVMQVSLEEGLAVEMDVKDEPQDSTVAASPHDHLHREDDEEEEDEKEEEEEEEEVEEKEEYHESSSIFPESVFAPLRLGGMISTPQHQQEVGAYFQDQQQEQQQQQQQQGVSHRLLPHSSQPFPSTMRLHNTPVHCNTNPQAPSLKTPLGLSFPSPYLPHTGTHALPFPRSPLGANNNTTATEHLTSTAKRPKLETLEDVGRLRGCGGGLSSRLSTSHCCCPHLHSALASQAQQEHQLRMKALMEESEARAAEHTIRMRILAMEEEVLRARLGRKSESEQRVTANNGSEGGADGGGDGDDDC